MVEDVIRGVHVRQWYPREFLFVLVLLFLMFLSLALSLSPLVLPLGMLVRTLRRGDCELVVVRVSNVGIGRQRVVVFGCRVVIMMMVAYLVRGEMQIVVVVVLVVEGAEG